MDQIGVVIEDNENMAEDEGRQGQPQGIGTIREGEGIAVGGELEGQETDSSGGKGKLGFHILIPGRNLLEYIQNILAFVSHRAPFGSPNQNHRVPFLPYLESLLNQQQGIAFPASGKG